MKRSFRIAIVGGAVLSALALPLTPAHAAGAAGTVTGVAFEDTNRNGLVDAGEATWSGQDVLLYDLSDNYYGAATTDASGRYAFPPVAAGQYRVMYGVRTWWSLRNDWVPTTASLHADRVVTVDGDVRADFGWRRIVRSTTPLSTFTGPQGLRAESYNDVVTAKELYDIAVAGLVGREAPYVTLRMDKTAVSATAATAFNDGTRFTTYSAVSDVAYQSWLDGAANTLSHEYGHAWSLYNAYLVQQDPDLTAYLKFRGLYGDPRLNTDHAWSAREMLAEDYRQLLGAPAGRSAPQENYDIPTAADVPGLATWLRDTFTVPPAGSTPTPSPSASPSTSSTPSPSASPTSSPSPAASPSPSATPTPSASSSATASPSPSPSSSTKTKGGGRR
jgi:hypothetical protein